MTWPLHAAGAGTAEELLPGPDRAGRLGLVAQRPVGFTAPCTDREHLAVGVHRAAAEVAVDDPRALASLGDRRDDERLPDPRVAARVDAVGRGAVGLLGAD